MGRLNAHIMCSNQLQDIVNMSDDELNQKLEIEEQSIIRRAKEIKEHSNDLDAMFNDDYNRDQKSLDNDSRKGFISNNCELLFVSYLDDKGIQYKRQEDSTYSIKWEE